LLTVEVVTLGRRAEVVRSQNAELDYAESFKTKE